MAISFDGEFTVATTRAEVFAVLSETQKFAPLIPTYKSHEINDDGSIDLKIKVGVGKIRGTGTVILARTDCRPEEFASYTVKGKVMGGVFNLEAAFELEESQPGETTVKWKGDVTMFGKLVSMAGGMIKPIANKDIERMIEAIRIALSGEAEEIEQAPEAVSEQAAAGWLGKLKASMRKLLDFLFGFLRKEK